MTKRFPSFVVNQQWLTIKNALTRIGVEFEQELQASLLDHAIEDPRQPITVPVLQTFMDLLVPRLTQSQFHQFCKIAAKQNVSDALDMTDITKCKTVYEALDVYCKHVSQIMTDSKLSLEDFIGESWLKSFRPHSAHPSYLFSEAYGLIFFTELIAQLSGMQWKANKFSLASSSSEHVDKAGFVASPTIYLQREFFGIRVEPEILKLPVKHRRFTSTPSMSDHIGNDFELALQYVVLSLLGDKVVTLKQISSAIDLSTRTIQRRLQDSNSNFQSFYEDLIVSEAKRRLAFPDAKVTNVCYQLGYSSPPSFIRFFKQKTGVTPKQFQLKHTSEQ